MLTTEDELKIIDFFENDVNPLHCHFEINHSEVSNIILHYFKQNEILKGDIHDNRNEYQHSVDRINNRLIKYMEKEKSLLQKSYTNYFEQRKTDGIKYNIYNGQSIAPAKAFYMLYLKTFDYGSYHRWQLSTGSPTNCYLK